MKKSHVRFFHAEPPQKNFSREIFSRLGLQYFLEDVLQEKRGILEPKKSFNNPHHNRLFLVIRNWECIGILTFYRLDVVRGTL